ncbi:PREDICTED: A-kinase anchor protein 9 isoform X3 [Gekko japonicus]|uniref:A-kinase anchor protein 9 isoform X3 n=1 Tax=Gekko japonicus TaxID=146911 RepID=A0ABM1JRN6_GEKJA|nr:PREDICTED: A-kinase anchor protein 9 isoform X3 [Gekko japonicus]
MEDEERQKKLEAGKAKLAQFRQRKAHADGQNATKKQKKKKKVSNTKDEELVQEGLDIDQSQGEDTYTHSCERGAVATPDFAIVRTLHSSEMIKHDQTYTTELESEISTTADDYSSEVNGCSFLTKTEEEEFGFGENYSELGMQHSLTRLEMVENELAGKQQEIEELNRELEEMRAAYGTEGLQQLQEFEAAIKKRDDIITQLTANLQQARKEKDETMKEFLDLTEQSQKLQIQFQHLQASEALRNTSHSSTAADLLQTKQQILAYQQQLEEQEQVLRSYQMKNEDYEMQVSLLQQRIAGLEMERRHVTEEDSIKKKLQEKETIIEKLEAKIREEEENIVGLQKKVSVAEKSVEELKEEVLQKNREVHNVRVELASSKQKEKQCSDEIKQLMGTVEELQKRCHKDSQLEKDIMQRMEHEAQRRLEDLRAELEEVHGQQIVHMKQELVREHTIEIEKLLAQQKADLERTLNLGSGNANEDQIHLMNIAINELNMMLQDANYQREKTRQDFSQQLEEVTSEKSSLKSQIEDLCQELSLAREQIQRAQRTINEKDTKLHDSEELLMSVGDLKAELASAVEIQKELEIKHEAEITNYKIKLEMLEREKDAVLDRMAESQEAELERLRTQLLFSHEEELSKLRDDLLQEHRINTENLKDNLHMKHRQQLDGLQNEMTKKIEAMKSENDDLTVKQTQLTLEISRLKDLQQAMANSKSEEMRLQIHELQKEVDILRQEKKEKGMLEQEVQELQLKIESLKKQMKEREADLQEKCTLLETQNVVLEDENNALQEKFKKYAVMNIEETLIIDNISPNSQDFGLQNRIDDLIAENERLVKQEIVLKEEIEKQRNSLSFAEKNFEHNYQELREEYVSILKVKSDLEKSKNEQEAEYKARLQAFTEEIQNLQRDMPVTHKARSSVLHGKREKILRSETFDIEEVVEKETTELMEKLEVTHREKLELSLKLSDLSEELKLKDSEICQLSEEIQSLKRDKDCISVKCKELELILSHRQGENMKTCEHKPYSNGGTQVDPTTFSEPGSLISDSCKEYDSTVTEREEKRTPSNSMVLHIPVEEAIQQNLNPEPLLLLDNLQHMSAELAADPSRMSLVQSENKLQDQLDLLKSEQSDLKLQMEAQRICLSLVYSAHVDQVREYMENEKQTALSSLKEELQVRHAQELCEVKKNQMDYQATKEQKPDGDGRSVSVRLEGLSKTVAEECSKINQSLRSVLHEKPSIALEDDAGEREKSSTVLISRTEAQALERTLQTVLSKILEEHHNLLEYHAQLLKDITRVEELNLSHADHDEREIGNVQQNLGYLHMPSQDLVDFKVSQSHWEDMEKFKSQLEEQHAQEVEHLRSYYHQQLKETEERCTTEIAHMQSKLQDARVPSECFSICKKSQANEMLQKGKHAESGLQEIAEKSTELSNEVGMIEFLEKQYQEKLLEEIAKVVVTMSVQFAQKNELERIANLKGDDMLMGNNLRSGKECPEELDSCRDERIGTKYEATKSLSMEISEEYSETASTDRQFQPDVKSALVPGQHELDSMSPADSSSSVKELMQNTSLITSEDSISSTVSSKQVLLYEERLEDMRQELVRQYQEHQQATEMLKQGHMQQMEWQKENQELLQAELDRLKAQLAENIALDSDHIITEREQMLIEELELLKKQLTPEREMLSSELKTCSTQTQRENINETESKECVLEGEDGGGNHNEASSDIFSKERHGLQKANNRLLKILLEVVKTVVAVEETIGCHVVGLLDWSSKCQLPCRSLSWEAKTEDLKKTSVRVGYEAENSFSSYHGSNLEGDVSNIWSEVTDENLVVSQYLTEHGFSGVEMDSENQELVLNISFRLQAAVEKLLEAINETTNQLEHARVTQTELMRESFKREQEATELLKSQEDLQERLDEEVKARQQLALELGRAESLIDGYADEKSLLEKQIQEKTDVIEHLEQDLLCTGNKLQELEAERQQLQEEKELLFRQKDAMKADAGPIEQRLVDAAVDAASQAELLAETEKLMKEKIEVQRQAEKEYDYLQKQVKVLEADIEEQVNRLLELEQEKNAELMDLRQQNQALEKQLEKTKKFLDEQAIDREHERDVFQQEIQKLEHQLKIPQRFQPVNEHQNREVEQLSNHLKEKTDKCSELLLSKEQLQRDVQERNEEIEKLEYRIRELEQALMISADSLQKVEQRKQFGSAVRGELPLEAQLQAEQEAVDRKEKEIINLEEQLEQFREELENKNEEVQQLHMQLEIQRKEATTRQQELEQENKLFKEEMEKLGLAIQNPEDASIKDHQPLAGKFVQIVQEKEREINELHEQIAKLQQQLEFTADNKVIEGKNDHIKELEAQIEYLKSDQERVKQNSEQEIEQLNEVIEKLQQELANIEHKEPLDFSLIQEDADNLKHQLDVVFAEKEVLLKKVESSDVEVSRAKNELEETKLKVKKLKEELDALRESHKRMGEELENVQMRSGVAEVRGKLSEKPVNKKKTKIFNSVDENAKDSLINIDTKLQQLQTVLKEKDLELKQCYKQIKDLNEQAKVESEAFQQKIAELEETLAQKAAAALVIEAQLNAVLEQSKVLPEMHTGGPEEAIQTIQTEKVDSTVEEDAKLRLSALLEKLTEMERQVANAHSNLQLEKAKVEIAQKEAKEKEGRLTELQQLLAATEEKHKRERTKISKKTKAPQMVPEQSANKQRRLLPDDRELEKVRAESVAAKEELNSCQEKAEKMKEELMVKEASVIRLQEELKQTRGKLSQVEEKLAVYVQKEESPNKLERVCTKEESAVNRTNASCQTHKTVLINSCNQTLQLPTKNEEIQIDLQNGCSSEEVAEIIREFSEKIDQMQELHAAEIMDMETRHISESEALKREQFILVQELTEECNSLKAVIETLRDKEGIPSLSQSVSSNARDGCSSDSSSDWSQGVYLAPSLGSDTVSEEIGNEDESSADFLPKKIKGLLRAVHHEGIQVLNLTEFPCSDSDVPSLKQGAEYWMQERKAFLSTVSALKDLIAKMQVHGDPELYAGSEPSGGISDWRSELLFAVQQVFQREKDVLLAVFQTELAEGGTRDVVALIGQLEKRLQEQGTYQRTAVDCIQNADRISLLMEVKWLHSQLNNRRTDSKREAEIEPNCQELLGCNMEMQMELSNTKDKAAELQEQLNSERMMVAELNNGFGQAKLELETTLKAQHKHLRDLEAIRNELKVKTAELDMLKDTLASEQKKSRELQWTLEKEKAKMERSEGRGREELEDLKYSLEHEKQKVIELNNFLEFEKQLSSNLEKKVQSQEALNAAQLSQERSCNSELQVLLESERFRVLELSSALERGKELCAQLQAAEQKRHDGTLKPAEELLGDLQKQLDEKHGRIVELVSEMERYKLESVQLKQQMEKEKQIQRNTLQAEQEAHLLAQKKVNELESKVEDLQWQLEEKRQQVHQLQCEEKKVQEIIQELQQEQRKEAGAKAEIATHQNLNEATWDTSNERTRKWVFQQKMGAAETKELSCSSLIGMGGGDVIKESQNLQAAREKLRNVSSKLKLLANKAVNRLPFEKTDDEDFVGIQNDIEEVLLHLQMSSGFSSLEAELNSELPPFSSLTERLLKQNAELTGFVSRLSEEKNNLRNVIMKLEEELRRFQHRGPCGDSPFRPSLCNGGNTGALISSEGEIWKREKLTLQQSLKDAEAELVKLRAELRNEAFLRELGSDSENAALKRIYGRYLRAESFRKALIYQKKYLLLLLGGFQECEEATLSLIARMGGQPSYTDLEVVTRRPKGFTRFRSAVRVLIAISRMKFLVHRWHRITGYSSVGTSRDGFSQNTVGNELSGGLELYGEQRPSSYRSRSELESLRSPLSYQHRYQGVHPDLSPVSLACSQLQNYDPDRALTDYINRLEALQKRLGTVQPAPASYAQLHSGIRR